MASGDKPTFTRRLVGISEFLSWNLLSNVELDSLVGHFFGEMSMSQLSVFQKVLQLPMSYDCLTHMLTHPLRDYMFGLRGGLFRRGLTRSLRGSIRYCPHRNCLREPFVASFPFILAFCGFISFHFGLLCLPQQC